VVGHLLGRLSCSMCSISHGPLGRTKAWKAWAARLEAQGIEVVTAHRDEIDADLRNVVGGRYPAVIATAADGTHTYVLGDPALAECAGSVDALASRLEAAGIGTGA
jgi:hypothetical protein